MPEAGQTAVDAGIDDSRYQYWTERIRRAATSIAVLMDILAGSILLTKLSP
jgi:hypothetical protein